MGKGERSDLGLSRGDKGGALYENQTAHPGKNENGLHRGEEGLQGKKQVRDSRWGKKKTLGTSIFAWKMASKGKEGL